MKISFLGASECFHSKELIENHLGPCALMESRFRPIPYPSDEVDESWGNGGHLGSRTRRLCPSRSPMYGSYGCRPHSTIAIDTLTDDPVLGRSRTCRRLSNRVRALHDQPLIRGRRRSARQHIIFNVTFFCSVYRPHAWYDLPARLTLPACTRTPAYAWSSST